MSDAESVPEPLGELVESIVAETEGEDETLGQAEAVCEGAPETEAPAEGETLAEPHDDGETEGEPVEEPHGEAEYVRAGEGDVEGDEDALLQGDTEALPLAEAHCEA